MRVVRMDRVGHERRREEGPGSWPLHSKREGEVMHQAENEGLLKTCAVDT